MIPSTLVVEASSMSIWIFLAIVATALLLGYGLGVASGAAFGRSAGGKPWWYDVAFPSPDETTLGAMKVLADRYALGEIGADEFSERVAALRKVSETPEQRKLRLEREARQARKGAT
ncbi:MAG: hypothetical protein QM778_04735 [Myxococcales bacterium]